MRIGQTQRAPDHTFDTTLRTSSQIAQTSKPRALSAGFQSVSSHFALQLPFQDLLNPKTSTQLGKSRTSNQIFGVPKASDAHENQKPWPVKLLVVPAPFIARRALTAPLANDEANRELDIKPEIYNDMPRQPLPAVLDEETKTLNKMDEENITSPDSSLFSKDGKDYNGAVSIQNTASLTARYINAHLRGYMELGASVIWAQGGPDSQTGVMKVYGHASREIDKTESLKNHILDRGMRAQLLRLGVSYQESLGSTSPLSSTRSLLSIPLAVTGALKKVKLGDDHNLFIGSELQNLDFQKAQGFKYIYGNIYTLLGKSSAASLTGRKALGGYTYQIPHYQRWAFIPVTFWTGAGAPLDRSTYFRPLHLGIDRPQLSDPFHFYAVSDVEHMGALTLYENSASVDYKDMRILRSGRAINIADTPTRDYFVRQSGLDPKTLKQDGTLDTDGGIFAQTANSGVSPFSLDVPSQLATQANTDNSTTETQGNLEITRDKANPATVYKIVEKSRMPSWLQWLTGKDATYVPVSAVSNYLQQKARDMPDQFGGLERADADTLRNANFNSPLLFGDKEHRDKTFGINHNGSVETIAAFNVDDTINTGFGAVAAHEGIFKLNNLRDNDIKAQAIFAQLTQQSLKNFSSYLDPAVVQKDGSRSYVPAVMSFLKDSLYFYLRTKYLMKYVTLPNLAIKGINENIVRGGTLPAAALDYINPLAYKMTPQSRAETADTINHYNLLDLFEHAADKLIYSGLGWALDGAVNRAAYHSERSADETDIKTLQDASAAKFANYKNGTTSQDDARTDITKNQDEINAISHRMIDRQTPLYRRTMWVTLDDQLLQPAIQASPQKPQEEPTPVPPVSASPTPQASPSPAATPKPQLTPVPPVSASPTPQASPSPAPPPKPQTPPVQPTTPTPAVPQKQPQIKIVFRRGDTASRLKRLLDRQAISSVFADNYKSLSLNDHHVPIGQNVDVIPQANVDATQESVRAIRVRRGDTAYRLSREFYGTPQRAAKILELNAARLSKGKSGRLYLKENSLLILPAVE